MATADVTWFSGLLLVPLAFWQFAEPQLVMGGFTTYSTFNYETLEYLRQGAWFMGCLNVVGTGLACLLAGVLGLCLGKAVAPAILIALFAGVIVGVVAVALLRMI